MIGILTDVTRCVGCEKCIKACQKENNCSPERPEHKTRQGELFDTRWTSIVQQPDKSYMRKHCRHCLKPACVSVCPVGAMSKSPVGPVDYNKKKCIGCRYCMMACPFGIPRYEWNSLSPGITKCTLCHSRVANGQEPACTEACPENATIFGSRPALIEEARRRIRLNPDKYIHHIFGEHEIGGVSVLYLSHVQMDFSVYKKAVTDLDAVPLLNGKALKAMPAALGGVCAVFAGLRWIIDRRMKIRNSGLKKGR